MGCKFVPKRLLGRLRDVAESDSGHIAHAVCYSERSSGRSLAAKALCGARPGPKSVGWGTYDEEEVTCPKCLARLSDPPVFTITKAIDNSSEMLLIKYNLLENGEVCGHWFLRTNHQDFFGLRLSWGIHFIEEFRGCCCFLGCKRSEYLISEVASKHEKGNIIYVKRTRLNDEQKRSEGLFGRMETEGYVKVVE